jgi:hypothetical protein
VATRAVRVSGPADRVSWVHPVKKENRFWIFGFNLFQWHRKVIKSGKISRCL